MRTNAVFNDKQSHPSPHHWQRAIITLLIAFTIETSQMYQADWLIAIRSTTLGGLVLGHSFLWTDFFCYSVGLALGRGTVLASKRIVRNLNHNHVS